MGRMVCEGSNKAPAPRIEDGSAARIGNVIYGSPPGGIAEFCAVCATYRRPLKSGVMPKHTRYVSWQERRASASP